MNIELEIKTDAALLAEIQKDLETEELTIAELCEFQLDTPKPKS